MRKPDYKWWEIYEDEEIQLTRLAQRPPSRIHATLAFLDAALAETDEPPQPPTLHEELNDACED